MMQLIDQVKKIETYICEYFEDWDLDDPVEEGYLEDYFANDEKIKNSYP